MTHTTTLTHYLNTAQYLRERGHHRWARVYARLAIEMMEGRDGAPAR